MTDSKLDINREEPGKAIAYVDSVADARHVGGLGTERLTTCFAQLWSQRSKVESLKVIPLDNCSGARVVIRYVIPSPICWSLSRIPPTQPSPASPLPPVAPELVFYLARAAVCSPCCLLCCRGAAVLWLWLWCGAVLLLCCCGCGAVVAAVVVV